MNLKPHFNLAIVALVLAGIGYAYGQSNQDRADRQYRSSRHSHSHGDSRSSDSSQVPGPEDYAAFSHFISERNIFNPNRFPHTPGYVPIAHPSSKPSRSAPAFAFVGAMYYGKGMFAFFDGNNDEYRKSLQVSGTIAGFTVQAITLNQVVLEKGSNTVNLAVGAMLQKSRDGTWAQFDQSEDFSAQPESTDSTITTTTTTSSTDNAAAPTAPDAPAAPAGQMSDILKKLMKQRELENK